jgi:hypothetical protein
VVTDMTGHRQAGTGFSHQRSRRLCSDDVSDGFACTSIATIVAPCLFQGSGAPPAALAPRWYSKA